MFDNVVAFMVQKIPEVMSVTNTNRQKCLFRDRDLEYNILIVLFKEMTALRWLTSGLRHHLARKFKMAENKTKPTSASVDDFIAAIDNPRRRADAQTTLAIYKDLTGLPPVMWGPSIIGFGSQHYVYETGREGDMPAAGFSPRKTSMTFYLGENFEGARELYAKLGKHKKSVACLYINKLDDVDLEVLREIISRQYAKVCA